MPTPICSHCGTALTISAAVKYGDCKSCAKQEAKDEAMEKAFREME